MAGVLKDLTKKLSVCKKLSVNIVKHTLVFLKYAENHDEEYYEEILSQKPKYYSNNYIFENIIRACTEIVSDAENVLTEIDGFSKIIIKGDGVTDYEKQYPFLTRVWSGDIYDRTNIEGIEYLIKDLEKSLEHVDSEETFFKFVKENYLY